MNFKKILFVLLPLIGFLFSVISAYPGFMSQDSLNQYEQALSGHYTDWHPPIMAWLWHQLLFFNDGPFPMLLLQNVLFWLGAFLIVKKIGWNFISFIFLLLCFSPSLLNFLGVIWKDTLLLSVLSFTTALLYYFKDEKFKGLKLWAISISIFMLIFLGVLLRHNAAAAAWPLIILVLVHLYKQERKMRVFLISSLAVVLMFFAGRSINSFLCAGKSQYPQQQLMVYDLLSVSHAQNKSMLPDYLKSSLPLDTIHKIYNYYDGGMYAIFNLKCVTEKKEQLDSLKDAWKSAIKTYPQVVYDHKYWTFRCLQDESSLTTYYSILPNNHGIKLPEKNLLRDWLIEYLESASAKKLYKASIYLKGCAIIFVLSLLTFAIKRTTKISFPLLISLSGLLYGFSYFPLSPCTDLRYNYWVIAAMLLSGVFYLQSVIKVGKQK